MISSETRNFNLHLFGIIMLHASHASCEAALRAMLRQAKALAEQPTRVSLESKLSDSASLGYLRRRFAAPRR